MEKKNASFVGLAIIAFVALLFGSIAVQTLAEQSNLVTTQSHVYSENVTVPRIGTGNTVNDTYAVHLSFAAPGSDWRADYSACNTNNVVVKNASGTLLTSGNYTVYPTNGVTTGIPSGDLIFANTTTLVSMQSNDTFISYDYCADNYVAQGFGRTALNLTLGLFAVGLLGVGVWFAMKQFEKGSQ